MLDRENPSTEDSLGLWLAFSSEPGSSFQHQGARGCDHHVKPELWPVLGKTLDTDIRKAC